MFVPDKFPGKGSKVSKIFPTGRSQAQSGDDDIVDQAVRSALGLDKTRSNDCVEAIMAEPMFGGDKPSDWKRRSKRKDTAGNWVRTFENKATGASAEVTETTGGVTVKVIQGPAGGAHHGITGGPAQGFNGISLVPPVDGGEVDSGEWSGRVIFDMEGSDGNNEEEEKEEGEVQFWCGPEMQDGYVSDQSHEGTIAALGSIFSDIPGKWIDASENMHIFPIPQGMTWESFRELIRTRLLAAGAVPKGSPMPHSPSAG